MMNLKTDSRNIVLTVRIQTHIVFYGVGTTIIPSYVVTQTGKKKEITLISKTAKSKSMKEQLNQLGVL